MNSKSYLNKKVPYIIFEQHYKQGDVREIILDVESGAMLKEL